jgi:hypothetical protein
VQNLTGRAALTMLYALVQIQEFMLDLVPEATKGPTEGRNADHMGLVLSIVYNSTELTLADIQRALALSKPSDEVWPP